MIDDDFERLFDRMIRKLFGSIDAFSDSNSIIRFGLGPIEKDSLEIDRAEHKKPQPEQIDLDEALLIILDVDGLEDEPIVEINEGHLVIHWGPSEDKMLRLPLSYAIDLKKSNFSAQNGIMEIHLAKLDNSEEMEIKEGIIRRE